MSNNADESASVGPFSSASLLRDALPIGVVVFVTTLIAFAQGGDAYDQHWTTAWLLLGLVGTALAATRMVRLTHPLPWGAGMLILFIQAWRGGHAQWESFAMWCWLWTWIWTSPNTEKFFWRGIKALPLFAMVIGSIMLLQALKLMWNGDWGHTASYAMTLPWSHRNIAMESMFMMAVLGGFLSPKRWFRWWLMITLLAFVYQVRGVMLGSALWMVYSLWNSEHVHRWVKRGFMGAAVLFLVGQVAWNTLPYETRHERFKKVPDVVKSLDVVYNLNGAESSSIRLKLWSMTAGQVTALGEGMARWRDDAEGFVNVATGRCGEATRRAHSELLQWTYELGWLPLLVLIGLCWPLRRSMLRWLWFGLPFLAFTFPTERAEILWPMAVLGWWFKAQYPPEESKLTPSPHLLPGMQAATLALLFSWVTAQNAIGGVLRQSGAFKVDWSPMQETCINLHPKDIALNHADVIRAMGDYNNRRPESAKALIDGHLADNPLSIPAIRVHLKSQGKPNDEDAVCRYLKEQIVQGVTLPNR